MKTALSLLMVFVLGTGQLSATSLPIQTLRKIFHNAVLDASQIASFTKEMDKIKDPTPIELAYKAAAEALKAQEEWNPVEKLLYLRKFNRMMSRAVAQDMDEIEIRFLRFGIEHNIPGVLGFSKNMHQDKSLIISSVSKIERFEVEEYFAIYILNLLSDSGLCSDQEIALVKSKIEHPSPLLND